jgi:hypothetical protein
VVAFSESDAQAWREGKENRWRCGGGRHGSSLFVGAEGVMVMAEEWSVLIGTKQLAHNWLLLFRLKEGEGETCVRYGAVLRPVHPWLGGSARPVVVALPLLRC